MKLAIVVSGSQKDYTERARTLLSCAMRLVPDWVDLWIIGGAEPDEHICLPVDAVYHIAEEGRGCPIAAEEWMPALLRLYEKRRPETILFPASISGNELVVRTGFRTGGGSMTEVSAVELLDDCLVVRRAAYGSNLVAEFRLSGKPYVISVAKGAFEPVQGEGSPERFLLTERIPDTAWRADVELQAVEQEDGLESADLIIAGGRGVGGKTQMELLRELSGLLRGKLGGSRPAVLDGWLRYQDMLGSSGNVVRPRLCLIMGASGSGPFMAGVGKSERIIAVNSDPGALIFKYCDWGIVDDCNAVAKELKQIILTQGVAP